MAVSLPLTAGKIRSGVPSCSWNRVLSSSSGWQQTTAAAAAAYGTYSNQAEVGWCAMAQVGLCV